MKLPRLKPPKFTEGQIVEYRGCLWEMHNGLPTAFPSQFALFVLPDDFEEEGTLVAESENDYYEQDVHLRYSFGRGPVAL